MNSNYQDIIKTLTIAHSIQSTGFFDSRLEKFFENEAFVKILI